MRIDKVLVTGRLRQELKVLTERFPGIDFDFQDVLDPVGDQYDGYIGFAMAPGTRTRALKWVHSLGAGVDGLLLNHPFSPDVIFTRTVGEMPSRIGRYCLMCLLLESYRMPELLANNQNKLWRQPDLPAAQGRVLNFGAGAIGVGIAQQLSAQGYSCYAVSRSGRQREPFLQVEKDYSAYQGMKFAWLINALPLTGETRGYFDWQLFSALGQANFINIGRGQTVVEADLIRAVEENLLGRCYLDVAASEPLGQDSPLWRYPGIIITPHIAGLTAKEEAIEEATTTLARILANEPPPNRVDLDQGY